MANTKKKNQGLNKTEKFITDYIRNKSNIRENGKFIDLDLPAKGPSNTNSPNFELNQYDQFFERGFGCFAPYLRKMVTVKKTNKKGKIDPVGNIKDRVIGLSKEHSNNNDTVVVSFKNTVFARFKTKNGAPDHINGIYRINLLNGKINFKATSFDRQIVIPFHELVAFDTMRKTSLALNYAYDLATGLEPLKTKIKNSEYNILKSTIDHVEEEFEESKKERIDEIKSFIGKNKNDELNIPFKAEDDIALRIIASHRHIFGLDWFMNPKCNRIFNDDTPLPSYSINVLTQKGQNETVFQRLKNLGFR